MEVPPDQKTSPAQASILGRQKLGSWGVFPRGRPSLTEMLESPKARENDEKWLPEHDFHYDSLWFHCIGLITQEHNSEDYVQHSMVYVCPKRVCQIFENPSSTWVRHASIGQVFFKIMTCRNLHPDQSMLGLWFWRIANMKNIVLIYYRHHIALAIIRRQFSDMINVIIANSVVWISCCISRPTGNNEFSFCSSLVNQRIVHAIASCFNVQYRLKCYRHMGCALVLLHHDFEEPMPKCSVQVSATVLSCQNHLGVLRLVWDLVSSWHL